MAIFADPLATVQWLPVHESKATFVPIGANVPECPEKFLAKQNRNGKPRTVVVFCLSDLPNRTREVNDVFSAMRFVHDRGLKSRVIFLGRGTDTARQEIERVFSSSSVEVLNVGLQSAEKVSRILANADAMLCVRGPIYPRRGSAIAGIACGLPIVAYSGAATGTPLEEAGVKLVPYGDRAMLGQALETILANDDIWMDLHTRSLRVHRAHFSWESIAANMKQALTQPSDSQK